MSTGDDPGVEELGTKSEPGAKTYKIKKFFSACQKWVDMERQEDWILTHDTREECLYVSNATDERILQFLVKSVVQIESCEISSKIVILKKAPFLYWADIECLYCEFQDSNLACKFLQELKALHSGFEKKIKTSDQLDVAFEKTDIF
ncbi:hypothetical protein IFR05_011453 [Cadophora sp. M221]|nr:hypothetical protein IFR05_011453 [Cadophora sp. M221]